VVPAPDVVIVYPEYDVATRTWFLPGTRHEAETLRALQRLVGSRVRFAGYRVSTFVIKSIPRAIGVHPVRHARRVAAGRAADQR
jgi:hypothetical protein